MSSKTSDSDQNELSQISTQLHNSVAGGARDLRQWPAPWLFSLLILPLGIVVVGFNFTALPLLLAQAAVPLGRAGIFRPADLS